MPRLFVLGLGRRCEHQVNAHNSPLNGAGGPGRVFGMGPGLDDAPGDYVLGIEINDLTGALANGGQSLKHPDEFGWSAGLM